ncbi:Nse4 C-terminal-domain-containing protein [Paraphysoderma sedebokerense]|nr:Nse4 C-terminal-domain-containing protein [Paraphysoderma sedebokerense]KAI9139697.1 Nse4 C-terminal-domain-containing protein [Paraphysoderma sedebokerense]KAI9139703.1 Nse4 C-terminal-domain-containing protein [Paraphysoderma sedebokerense]
MLTAVRPQTMDTRSDDDMEQESHHSLRGTLDLNEYDPHQEEDERRGLRRRIRQLLTNVNESRSDLASSNPAEVGTLVSQASDIFNRVKTTQDAMLDTRFLLSTANYGVQRASKMRNSSSVLDTDEFMSRLFSFAGLRNTNEEFQAEEMYKSLETIGKVLMSFGSRVPTTDFMLGPLSVEAKKREVRQQRKRDAGSKEIIKPVELTQEDMTNNRQDTPTYVTEVMRILLENGQCNYYEFVINPHDFAQTVENIFYVSFLIKEGKATIRKDEETEDLVVYAIDSSAQNEEGIERKQLIMSIDFEDWNVRSISLNISTFHYSNLHNRVR